MNANIHERSELRDVSDNPFQDHANSYIFKFVDAFGKLRDFELATRIAPRLR